MKEFLLQNKLMLLRKKAGYSQQQVADSLAFKLREYRLFESGKTEPSLPVLKKIAKFYGISLIKLIDNSEDIMPNFADKNNCIKTAPAICNGTRPNEWQLALLATAHTAARTKLLIRGLESTLEACKQSDFNMISDMFHGELRPEENISSFRTEQSKELSAKICELSKKIQKLIGDENTNLIEELNNVFYRYLSELTEESYLEGFQTGTQITFAGLLPL